MLVVIILTIIAIFFPPAWFAVMAYTAYLIATNKSRRNRVFLTEIEYLLSSGQESTILSYMHYGTAKAFAADNGASMSPYKHDPEDDCLIFDMSIGGRVYSVCVQRWMKNDVMLTVKTKSKAKHDLVNALGKDSFLAEVLTPDPAGNEKENVSEVLSLSPKSELEGTYAEYSFTHRHSAVWRDGEFCGRSRSKDN